MQGEQLVLVPCLCSLLLRWAVINLQPWQLPSVIAEVSVKGEGDSTGPKNP